MNQQGQSNTPYGEAHMCFLKHIGWTPVMVGALIAIGLMFLINLFSVSINLSMVNPTSNAFALGGYIGILIGTIVILFVSGFASGYLSRPYANKKNMGALYGFTTWCLALVLMALLSTPLSNFVTTYTNFMLNPNGVTSTTANAAPTVTKTTKATAATARNANASAGMQVIAGNIEDNKGMTSFLVFILFFAGAFFCCVGAHCGLGCAERCAEACRK